MPHKLRRDHKNDSKTNLIPNRKLEISDIFLFLVNSDFLKQMRNWIRKFI